MAQTRPPCEEPYGPSSAAIDSFTTIEFYHPHHPSPADPLLRLPALDSNPDENDNARGIQYDFALAACGIIANNRWDDAFFTTLDNSQVSKPPGGLLCDTAYFFHVAATAATGDNEHYPVIPSFDFWPYPHRLPQPWRNLALPSVEGLSDLHVTTTFISAPCRLTGSWVTLEKAHIVPKSADIWFSTNQMHKYCHTKLKTPIDDMFNRISLRADVHGALDSRKICFVPKQVSEDPEVPQALVAHVITSGKDLGDAELRKLFHNRQIRGPTIMRREFLFARFAWTILTSSTAYPFLQTRKRSFAIYLKDGSTAHRTTEDIKTLTKPPRSTKSTATGTSTAATGDSRGKKRSAPADDSDGIESDSDSLDGHDSICAPEDMVRAWLANTIPMEAPTMPMENNIE